MTDPTITGATGATITTTDADDDAIQISVSGDHPPEELRAVARAFIAGTRAGGDRIPAILAQLEAEEPGIARRSAILVAAMTVALIDAVDAAAEREAEEDAAAVRDVILGVARRSREEGGEP